MKTVTMLEFRHHAESIIDQVQKGQRLIPDARGKPVVRLEPIIAGALDADDPFYCLTELAEAGRGTLTNSQIDEILYGK